MKAKEYIMYDNDENGIVVGIGTLKELAKIAKTSADSLRASNSAYRRNITQYVRYEIILLNNETEEE